MPQAGQPLGKLEARLAKMMWTENFPAILLLNLQI